MTTPSENNGDHSGSDFETQGDQLISWEEDVASYTLSLGSNLNKWVCQTGSH